MAYDASLCCPWLPLAHRPVLTFSFSTSLGCQSVKGSEPRIQTLLWKTGEGASQVGREGLGRTSPQSFVSHSCCGEALAGIW